MKVLAVFSSFVFAVALAFVLGVVGVKVCPVLAKVSGVSCVKCCPCNCEEDCVCQPGKCLKKGKCCGKE